ncbi:hypothetical protein BC937DRAFT_95687, partial [Endogone sp. FLAS-F59071]
LGVRTPSIFLLCKSVAILLSFLSSVYEWRDRLPAFIAEASAGMKGGEVLWAAFKAMSAVTITETFLSCIERRPSPQEQTVSLFEWALMLYFTTAGNEIFVVAFIQVCQLLVLQLTFLHPRGHAYRLIPTTIFGLIGLSHFCCSLWTLSPTYPYLQFLARVPELMVVCITIVSIFIHLLAMKVGNFRRHMFEPHSLPGTHEDYAVAIFKLGSACLEATRGVGYRNEAESIRVPVGTVLDRRSSIAKPDHKPMFSAFGNEMPDDVERTPDPDVPMYQQARLNHIRDFCRMCIELVKGWGKATKEYVKRKYRRIVHRAMDMPILPPEEFGRWREVAGGEIGKVEEQEDEEHDSDEELFRRFVADDWRLFEDDEDWEDGDYSVTEDGGDEDDEVGLDDPADLNLAADPTRSSAAPLVEELLGLAMDMREQDMPPSSDPSSSSSPASSSFFALVDSSATPLPTPLLSLFIAHYLHPTIVTRTRYRKMTTPSTCRSMEEDEYESHTLASLIQLARRPSLAATTSSFVRAADGTAQAMLLSRAVQRVQGEHGREEVQELPMLQEKGRGIQ